MLEKTPSPSGVLQYFFPIRGRIGPGRASRWRAIFQHYAGQELTTRPRLELPAELAASLT